MSAGDGEPLYSRLHTVWTCDFSANTERQWPPTPQDEDHILAALAQPDRVCRVEVVAQASLFEKLFIVMQQQFPELTHVRLWCTDSRPGPWCTGIQPAVPAITDNFFGGSVPRLRSLSLSGIPIPALPGILPSAVDLISLRLLAIPDINYILPECMVTCLSALTRLKSLTIGFQSFTPRPEQGRHPLPLIPVILPGLTDFSFEAGSDYYLDDFLARIDTPLLKHLYVTVFHPPSFEIPIEIPHLSRFILHTTGLTLPNAATMYSDYHTVFITLHQSVSANGNGNGRLFQLGISCEPSSWQVSNLARLCSEYLAPLLADVKQLYIGPNLDCIWWEEMVDDLWHWLVVLRPFTSVESLHISDLPDFAYVLEEMAKDAVMGETVEEMLPALRMIQFEGSHQHIPIEEFVAMRQRSGRPVNVRHRRPRLP